MWCNNRRAEGRRDFCAVHAKVLQAEQLYVRQLPGSKDVNTEAEKGMMLEVVIRQQPVKITEE
jgi:hypothetical protein